MEAGGVHPAIEERGGANELQAFQRALPGPGDSQWLPLD